MAVEIEFASVVIRKDALERAFPGGIDGFVQRSLSNFVEDDYIVRVGFMSSGEASDLLDELRANGISEGEAALVQGDEAPEWLVVGTSSDRLCCWLRGHPTGALVRGSDDAFVLLLPFAVRATVAEIARRCSAMLHPTNELDSFRCTRGDAEIRLTVVENQASHAHVLFLQREFSRRRHFAEDRALLVELSSTFVSAGAQTSRLT